VYFYTLIEATKCFGGRGGIRTRGTSFPVRQFSKLLVSASHPPFLRDGKFNHSFLLSINFFDLYFVKTIFFLLSFLLFCQFTHSQGQNWELGFGFGTGTLIPHSSKMRHLLEDYEKPLEISFLHRESQTHIYLHYLPTCSEFIGRRYSITPTHRFTIVDRKYWTLSWNAGAGIGYVALPFNIISNPKNIAIGTHINASILSAWQSSWKIGHDWKLQWEIQAHHFSNASFKKPNLGLNYLNSYVSFNHTFTSSRDWKTKEIELPLNHLSITGQIFKNQSNLPSPNNSWTRNFSAGYYFPISKKWFGEIGGDLFLDGSNRIDYSNILGHSFSLWDARQFGSYIGSGFWGNQRLGCYIQCGKYWYQPIQTEGPWYQRIGIRYMFHKNWMIQLGLKTHFAQADNFEVGIRKNILIHVR
jgi:hypothetical protein